MSSRYHVEGWDYFYTTVPFLFVCKIMQKGKILVGRTPTWKLWSLSVLKSFFYYSIGTTINSKTKKNQELLGLWDTWIIGDYLHFYSPWKASQWYNGSLSNGVDDWRGLSKTNRVFLKPQVILNSVIAQFLSQVSP